MATIKSKVLLLLLLSINYYSELCAHKSISSSSSREDNHAQLMDIKIGIERQWLVTNETNAKSDVQVSNVSKTYQTLNESVVYLNITEHNVEEEAFSSRNTSDDDYHYYQEFTTASSDESTVPSLSTGRVITADDVFTTTTTAADNYQEYTEGKGSSSSSRVHRVEDPLLRFDNISEEEDLDYESIERERQPLMTLIFNELRVNESAQHNMTPDHKFVELFTKIGKLYNLVIKDVTPLIIEKILTANTSFHCMNALAKVYEALNTNQHWVFKMLDANGHMPSGLMSGTLTSLGDYDQCLSVEDMAYDIRGQYCLLKVKSELPKKKRVITFKDRFINLNGTQLENTWINKHLVKFLYNFYYFSITNGICVPSACTQDDLVGIAKQCSFHLQVEVENCATKSDHPVQLDNEQSVALMVILTFVSVSLFATLMDILLVYNSHKYRNYFTQITECFSLRQNISKFFDTSSSLSHKSHTYNLQFIDGIKVLSMIWIIIGHTYISGAIFFNKDIPTANFYFGNLVDTINLPKQLFTQFVFNGLLAVDTFFFISGFLIVYLAVIKIVQERQQITFLYFVFLRWIRFSPLLVAIIAMNFLWPLLGSGPLFHHNYTHFMTDACYKYWWRNLLFISNWYPSDEQCMIHTWYMSADFQFYVISFFIIKLASSNIKNGMIACSSLVLLGVVIPTLVAFNNNLPPTIMYQADIENMALHASLMHYKSYNHLTPYFLGAFVACLLLRPTKLYVNYYIRCFFWITTLAGSLFVVSITYVWSGLEWEYTRISAALYFGSYRFIWSAGLAWIMFSCAQNAAGIINTILSSSIFKLTSRLTFSIYLSHMLILWFNFFRTKHLLFSTHYDFLFTSAGVYIFSLVFAFINHILFELPIINLVKFIIDHKRFSDKSSKPMSAKIIINHNNNCIAEEKVTR